MDLGGDVYALYTHPKFTALAVPMRGGAGTGWRSVATASSAATTRRIIH